MLPIERLARQAGSAGRMEALNLKNTPGQDGIIRGSILPAGTQQTSLNFAVAVVTLSAFVFWPYAMALLFIASWFSLTALVCFLTLTSTLALPAHLLWDRITCSYVLHCWQEYFHFSWIVEEKVEEHDTVIFAEFPHGAFPLGPLMAAGPCAIYFPHQKVYALAASAVFWVPIFKHLMTWMGCQPASRSNLKKLLKTGSVAVTPGGIAEMFFSQEHSEEIILRGRKGLIKTAIETGTPVVPCYHLGNSQTLRFGPAWLKPVSRRLRTSIGIVMGWMGTPLPVQVPIYMCVGKRLVPAQSPRAAASKQAQSCLANSSYERLPRVQRVWVWPDQLTCKPEDEGYDEQLATACDVFTERLAEAVQELYERHRHAIPGWENRPLIVH